MQLGEDITVPSAPVPPSQESGLARLAGARVLVLGLGVSGRAAARFCAERGAHVVAADEAPAEALGDIGEVRANAEIVVGQPWPDPADFDLVVPSPGIAPRRYAARASRVWGDIELAGRALEVPIVAVTGTNGKSTTTCMIEAMLRAAGLRARAAGNLGDSALDLVGEALDVAVLEVSSFQLEATEAFRPHVALLLNVSPDHLDRHGDLAAYTACKARIFARQHRTDFAVLDIDAPRLAALAPTCAASILGYSRTAPPAQGAWLDASCVRVRSAAGEARIDLADIARGSRHDLDNAAMALLAVHALGVDLRRAGAGLSSFARLPHRSEDLGEIGGVRYINDSKATNPGAAARSIAGRPGPVIWIAGGRNKALDFGPLARTARTGVRRALLIGEAAPALADALAGSVACEQSGTLERAVARAAEIAQPGDVVVLAPACASFDQFASYAARGEAFREAVRRLAPKGARR